MCYMHYFLVIYAILAIFFSKAPKLAPGHILKFYLLEANGIAKEVRNK